MRNRLTIELPEKVYRRLNRISKEGYRSPAQQIHKWVDEHETQTNKQGTDNG